MENNFAIPLESELTPGDGSCLAHALVDQMTRDPLLSLNRQICCSKEKTSRKEKIFLSRT